MNTPHISTPIPRRRFLRGLGVTLALPALECLKPVFARAAAPTSPKRMLLISNNLGVLPQHFFPKDKGLGYTPSPYLKELAAFRSDFTIFSGLSHPAVTGGHSTENCFLTAAREPTRSGLTREFWVVGAYFRRGRATRHQHPSTRIVLGRLQWGSHGSCRTHSP